MRRPDFKSGWGRQAVPGGFDSHALPPTTYAFKIMRIDHIRLKNWLNFRKVDAALAETTYLIGPNASGKSNFLDLFRFLRTDRRYNRRFQW